MTPTKHTPGGCPGCGLPMKNTGAPIWEDYCASDDCTWHRDEFMRFFANSRKAFEATLRVRDAAPDLLEALKAAASSAGFQYMLSETRDQIDAAISKAEGEHQ